MHLKDYRAGVFSKQHGYKSLPAEREATNDSLIIALTRGLKQKIEPELPEGIDQGRLLIITSFEEKVKRVTEDTSAIRNKMMIELADEIVVGFASKGGKLAALLRDQSKQKLKYL